MSDRERREQERKAAAGDPEAAERAARIMERSGHAPHEARPQLVAQIAGQIYANKSVAMYRAVYDARALVDMVFQRSQEELQKIVDEDLAREQRAIEAEIEEAQVLRGMMLGLYGG